jgi:hypothetical protein
MNAAYLNEVRGMQAFNLLQNTPIFISDISIFLARKQ